MSDVDRLQAELADALTRHGATDVRTLTARHALALELAAQDRSVALDMLTENLQASELALGIDDPVTVRYRGSVADVLRDMGRHQDALPLLRVNFSALSQTKGAQSDATIETCYQLGDSLRQTGMSQEALRWLRKAVADAEISGERTLALRASNSMAIVLEEQGQGEEALEIFEHNLGEAEQLMPSSPLTLAIRDNLADSYDRAGRYDDALRLYQQTFEDREAFEPAGSPGRVLAAWNLAATLRRSGDVAQARIILTTAAQTAQEARGEADRVALGAWARLAFMHRAQEEFDQALAIYDDVLAKAVPGLGENDRDTLSYRNQRAICLSALGDTSQAEREYRDVLRGAEKNLGIADIDTLTFRRNLAQLEADGGWYDEALPLLETNATLSDQATDLTATDRSQHQNVFLQMCRTAGQPERAIAWLEPRIHNGDSASPDGLKTLAGAYWDAGRPGDALSIWRRVLDEADRTAVDSAEALRARDVLIDAFTQQGRHEEAAKLATEQLVVLMRTLSDTVRCERAVDVAVACHLRAGDLVSALPLLERAADAIRLRLGEWDERTYAVQVLVALVTTRVNPDARAQMRPRLEEAVRRLEQGFGACPTLVQARRGLAEVAAADGDLHTAHDHLKHAVNDGRVAFGPYHCETLAALYELATVEIALDHPHGIESLVELIRDGATLQDSPKTRPWLDRARQLLRQRGERQPVQEDSTIDDAGTVVRSRRRLAAVERDHGPDSSEAIWELIGLGDQLRSLKLHAEALRTYDEAAFRAHADVEARLVAANRHAMVLEASGEQSEALMEYEQNVIEGEAMVGGEHPLTDLLRHNLADAYENLSRMDAAQWHFGHNVHNLSRRLGDGDAQTIDTRRRLAWVCLAAGRREVAFLVARRAYRDGRKHLAPGAEILLAVRNVFAMCHESLGNWEEALSLYEQNLVEAETSLGERDQNVVALRNNLARLYRDKGRLDEAITLYEKSAAVTGMLTDERRVDILQDLAVALMLAGNLTEAADAMSEARDLAVEIAGAGSDLAMNAAEQWAQLVDSSGEAEEHIEAAAAELSESSDQATALDLAALLQVTGKIDEADHIRAIHDLPIADRSSDEVLLLAYALQHSDGSPQPEQMVRDRLEQLAAQGLWAITETTLLAGLLADYYRRKLRFADLAELVARNVRELEALLGVNHPRSRQARVRRADVARKMGARVEAVLLLESEMRSFGTRSHDDDPIRKEVEASLAAARRSAERLVRGRSLDDQVESTNDPPRS